MGLVIIIDYFFELFKDNNYKVSNIQVKDIRYIITFALCYTPSIFTLIYNYYSFGVFNLQSLIGLSKTELWYNRFWAYLFDLNFGFFPYFSISFIIFLFIVSYGLFKRDRYSFLFFFAFFGTVFLYSRTWHINCGMNAIARYNAWTFPIFVMYLNFKGIHIIVNENIRRILFWSAAVSSIITIIIVYSYSIIPNGINFRYMTPIAEAILNYIPAIYSPYPYTFISRTKHIDGYDANEPSFYSNKDGNIRKVLFTDENYEKVIKGVRGDHKAKYLLKNMVEKKKSVKGFTYIDIPKDYKLKENRNYPKEFNPSKNLSLDNYCIGVYYNEKDFHWISPRAIIILKDYNYKAKGMKLIFGPKHQLHKEKELKIDIYINEVFIINYAISDKGLKQMIIIDKNKMPEAIDELYEVKIISNSYFNPEKLGLSRSDNRDLAVVLYYIGRP